MDIVCLAISWSSLTWGKDGRKCDWKRVQSGFDWICCSFLKKTEAVVAKC